jgi:tRNA (cytidine/uridine-2'-O-)-methyltransferase
MRLLKVYILAMIHIALYQPEIPPNTGNIIRLCANSGAQLHLIHPLGFDLSEKQCRRAGLDYHEMANVMEYDNYESFLEKHGHRRIFACTTKATEPYTTPSYQDEDMFLFGPETRGLPTEILDTTPQNQKIKIPMLATSRSLNLSNATAIILYESLRQLDFQQAKV